MYGHIKLNLLYITSEFRIVSMFTIINTINGGEFLDELGDS
jgi:hypothetical protein